MHQRGLLSDQEFLLAKKQLLERNA
jgi:hypothetical protein